jgi:hypothetical protein
MLAQITGNIGFLSGTLKFVRKLISNYRRLLTNYDSVLAYSLLGVIGGVASGLVILGFEHRLSSCALGRGQ